MSRSIRIDDQEQGQDLRKAVLAFESCHPLLEETNGADVPSIVTGYEKDENETVAMLLDGMPSEGGSATKSNFEKLVRAAFQGGLVAVKYKKSSQEAR